MGAEDLRLPAPARTLIAFAIIGLLHWAVILALLSTIRSPAAPKEVVIEVILTPPLTALARTRPAERPPVARAPQALPTRPSAPIAAGNAVAKATPPSGRNWTVKPEDSAPVQNARRSMRAGVGCREAKLLALTKAERAACDDKLGAGAKDAPAYAVISPKLKKEFDGVFECPEGDVWCEYRIGKAPYPGLFAPHRKKHPDWD